jgi:hypothetical protein
LAAVACQPDRPQDYDVTSDPIYGLSDCERRTLLLDPEDEFGKAFDYRADDPDMDLTFDEFRKQYLLMRYAEEGNLVKIQEIVQSGVRLDYSLNLDSNAPAMAWAARCNRVEVVKYLHEQGANINVTFSYIYPAGVYHGNVTPLFWADEFGSKEASSYLRKVGAKEIKERVEAIPWDYAVKKSAKER